MFEIAASVLLIVVLLGVRPAIQRRRERALAERLMKTRDPIEALITVDTAIEANKEEGRFFHKLRGFTSFWFK